MQVKVLIFSTRVGEASVHAGARVSTHKLLAEVKQQAAGNSMKWKHTRATTGTVLWRTVTTQYFVSWSGQTILISP